jgi:hypothetical protein
MQCYEGIRESREAIDKVRALRAQLKALGERAGQGPLAEKIAALDQKAAAIEGGQAGGPRGAGPGEMSLTRLMGDMTSVMELLQGADQTPTTQAAAAVGELQRSLKVILARWDEIKRENIKSLNDQLRQASLPLLPSGL